MIPNILNEEDVDIVIDELVNSKELNIMNIMKITVYLS